MAFTCVIVEDLQRHIPSLGKVPLQMTLGSPHALPINLHGQRYAVEDTFLSGQPPPFIPCATARDHDNT